MTRSSYRLALVATALPVVLLGVGGTAHAEDPTCVGTSSVGFVCDPQVTPTMPVGVETYPYTETVCVGVTCHDVDLILVRVTEGDPLEVCVTWTNRDGSPGGNVCAIGADGDPACLGHLAGEYGDGLVVIEDDGDVYVAGEFFWDCPPYEDGS